MLFNCLAVGCGGFIGSVLRYLASLIGRDISCFPFGTLAINVLGCFAIAFISGLLCSSSGCDERIGLFLRVGLCGGFTTFSTFSTETVEMLERGDITMAALYAAASLVLCVLSCFAGAAVVKLV